MKRVLLVDAVEAPAECAANPSSSVDQALDSAEADASRLFHNFATILQ